MTESAKNFATIQIVDSGTVLVVKAACLSSYNRAWVSAPSLWPEVVIYYDDDGSDPIVKILKIDRETDCHKFAEQFKANQSVIDCPEEGEKDMIIAQLRDEVKDLTRSVANLKIEFNSIYSILRQIGTEPGYYIVGTKRKLVALSAAVESALLGFNSVGFFNLCQKEFGSAFSNGRTWKDFDEELQRDIRELLAFFVLCRYNSRKEQDYDAMEEDCGKILLSFQNMLSNHKYQRKKKNVEVETSEASIKKNKKEFLCTRIEKVED